MYYDKNGYIDFKKLMEEDNNVYKFILGARGIGKTFGCLKFLVDNARKSGNKFVYMRRTQTQVDLIKTPELNPFNALEYELGSKYSFILKAINKNVMGIYDSVFNVDKNIYEPSSTPIGFIIALSTIANIRGIGGNDIDYIFYDEFVGELHEKPIKSEGLAFLNALETIGRNRELKNIEPLKLICASNSVNLGNPIFIELKFITTIEKAIKNNIDFINLKERLTSIYIIKNNPISLKKKDTALYKLSGTGAFTDMALDNEFTKENFDMVKSRKINDFKLICTVGEIAIYKHRSANEWYITDFVNGKTNNQYNSSDIDIKRWRNDYYYLQLAYLNRHIYFESYIHQVIFEKYSKV